MPSIDIETLIQQRGEFLKRHPRPGDFGVRFNRDFMEQHGLPLLCEIDNYDSGGWVQCTCQTLLGSDEGDRCTYQHRRTYHFAGTAGTSDGHRNRKRIREPVSVDLRSAFKDVAQFSGLRQRCAVSSVRTSSAGRQIRQLW